MKKTELWPVFGLAAALAVQPVGAAERLARAAADTLSGAEQEERPNILLFLVDDMGWQDTSEPFWKDTTPLNRIYRTPNMERMARQGVIETMLAASR